MEKIATATPRHAPPAPRPRDAGSENFPVASLLLPAALRAPVRAFYAVVRAADDIADDANLTAAEKHALLDAIEAGLSGRPGDPRGPALRAALARVGREGLERHAVAMLAAFRADVAGRPVESWSELRGYCHASAEPVGRFLLELHGEAQADLDAADALCAALQVLNHCQDLGEDWRDLRRLYLPTDWLRETGASPADLGGGALTLPLRAALDRTLDETALLLARARALPGTIRSRRLRAEVTVMLSLAHALLARLRAGDPLATRVAPTRGDWLRAALRGGGALVAMGRSA